MSISITNHKFTTLYRFSLSGPERLSNCYIGTPELLKMSNIAGKRKEPEPEENGEGQEAGREGNAASLDKEKGGKVDPAGNRQRSPVWNHFIIIEDSDPDNRRARCVHCGKDYACHPNRNGTSSLSNHIKKTCKKKPLKQANGQTQTTLIYEPKKESEEGGNSLVLYSFSLEACRKALAHMIVVDELPFRFVEAQGFRHFMRVVQPKFSNIPSRVTIAKDCLKLYVEEKMKLMAFNETLKDLEFYESIESELLDGTISGDSIKTN